MHDLIDIYTKFPAHNWRGYAWVYTAQTRMSRTLVEAKAKFCETNRVHPDSVKCKYAAQTVKGV